MIFTRKNLTMYPIWKDITIPLSASAPTAGVSYRVELEDGTVIYEGTAHARPGETATYIRINDILAPWLVRGFAPAGETDTPALLFAVYVGDREIWAETVYANWSYDPHFSSDSDPMNAPISDILLPGQLVPFTQNNQSEQIAFRVGYTVPGGDFNADFNKDFLLEATAYEDVVKMTMEYETVWLDLLDYPTAVSVEVGGRTYRVGGGCCNKHAFYYVNACGGWDTLVVEGKTDIFDGLTRYTLEKVYDNSQPAARGVVNYATEIARTYRFHTATMPQAASLKMHHLLNSPLVYVHDTVENLVRPLILTGRSTEHKHGARLYQYTIEASLAQNRLRR